MFTSRLDISEITLKLANWGLALLTLFWMSPRHWTRLNPKFRMRDLIAFLGTPENIFSHTSMKAWYVCPWSSETGKRESFPASKRGTSVYLIMTKIKISNSTCSNSCPNAYAEEWKTSCFFLHHLVKQVKNNLQLATLKHMQSAILYIFTWILKQCEHTTHRVFQQRGRCLSWGLNTSFLRNPRFTLTKRRNGNKNRHSQPKQELSDAG